MTLRNGIPLAHSLQSLTFSSMTTEHLTKLKIISTGFIDLKPNSEERIAATASLGQSGLWSSANLYRQLHLLKVSFLGWYVMICQSFCYSHTPPDRSKRSCVD